MAPSTSSASRIASSTRTAMTAWSAGSRRTIRSSAASTITTALVRPDATAQEDLRWLVERHLELTGSARAAELLVDWTAAVADFWHVVPLGRVKRLEAQNVGRVGGASA